MLNLYIGDLPDTMSSTYFDMNYKKSWILSDFSRRVIKGIDKSEVLGNKVISSPVLGLIPPMMLSGGTKTLIMLKFTNFKMKLSGMGDNCFKFLKEVADEKDIIMCTRTYRSLFLDGDFEQIRIINSGQIVTNPLEMLHEYVEVTKNWRDDEW